MAERPRIRKLPLKDLVNRVSQRMRVEVSDLVSGSRRDNVSMVRALIAYLAVREMRYRGSEVGRILGLSEPGIMKCVDRGKRMLNDDSELRGKLISWMSLSTEKGKRIISADESLRGKLIS